MFTSVFKVFKIGIGPSSSHTVGPMRAAFDFLKQFHQASPEKYAQIACVTVDLFGSLALTGIGHGTDLAILLGLEGEQPDTVDTTLTGVRLEGIQTSGKLNLWSRGVIPYEKGKTVVFNKMKRLPYHSNGMTFSAFNVEGHLLTSETYYSVGGGFILNHKEIEAPVHANQVAVPYEFSTGKELLYHCEKEKLSIAQLMMVNEKVSRTDEEIASGLRHVWKTMDDCITRGCETEGTLPGGLNVQRRAAGLKKILTKSGEHHDPTEVMDWVSLYALAVNEENAAGGRVVTAPTNGAAGIMPAVLKFYEKYYGPLSDQNLADYYLTSAAICSLFQENAGISGAEMGCQGEVGVACSMAAAGLAALWGGSIYQVERAAEIGMEHNLGLTCDPVKGLVQVPCIERNTMGAIKAINAAKLAMRQDHSRAIVSLDKVIKTMAQTGRDMKSRYKETSKGGLAINVVEC